MGARHGSAFSGELWVCFPERVCIYCFPTTFGLYFQSVKYLQGRQTMHEKSVGLLNKAVADELSAVHQYMYFHFHCDDQGYDLLAGLFRRTAIAEMLHIERLAERILFLKGNVELEAAEKVKKINKVNEMLVMARQMEEDSAISYNKWANECSANADSVSKQLFESLVVDEETHYDQYDTELENLEKFGDGYLALQSIERSKLRESGAANPAGA
jgi:bacterioferritin